MDTPLTRGTPGSFQGSSSSSTKFDKASSGTGPEKSSGNDNIRNAADSLASDVKEAAKSATTAVKKQASEFAADIGHELSKTAEGQKARGVEAMQAFARAITTAAAELESQSPRVAQSVRQAAEKVDDLSENIGNRNVDELLKAATDLARSQPMLFIGGAVAAGFALSRFLKSSGGSHSSSPTRSPSSSATHRAGVSAHG